LREQAIWDRKDKRIIRPLIRHLVDFSTLSQIYLVEDYKLWGLKRYDELWKEYTDSVEAGKRPLIVDCGGNIGLTSRYFSENFPQASIMCVEPESCNFEQAKLNTQNPGVRCILAGIGSVSGKATIANARAQANAFRVEARVSGEVDIITVDAILNAEPESYPFIIKVDIEGAEETLFAASTEWVSNFKVIMIELHDWMMPRSAKSKNFLKAISGQDRDLIIGREILISIRND
jgi:FkbM family methyltransferase